MPSRSRTCGGAAALLVFGLGGLAGCPRGGARAPEVAPLAPWHVALEGEVSAIAVAPDGAVLATVAGGVARYARGERAWLHALPGDPGAVAWAGDLAVVGVGGTGTVDLGGEVALRGEPGAALVGLAAADGAQRWVRPVGATGWVVVRAIAALPGGDVAAAGSFSGTLRIGDHVVSAGGTSDGFVTRVGPDGAVRWLVRIGGERADAITSVAAAPAEGGGLAVGGTYMGVADARGVALAPVDDRSLFGDAFVARLADDGAVRWARGFGGAREDAVAGVAITRGGIVAAAATLRDIAAIDGKAVTTRGLADAVVVTFDDAGRRRAVAPIGGADYDSAAAIAARGDDLVVGVAYSGTVVLGDARLDAAGGDGALVAVLRADGEALHVEDVSGPGREVIAALAATGGGWAVAIRHTAGARLGAAIVGAPSDPYAGAAIVVRGR